MVKPHFKIIIVLVFFLAFVFLSLVRGFEFFELVTLDWRFKLRPCPPVDPRIVIIEIGEDSLNSLGRWPFDRKYHAVLIRALAQAQAEAVVFDVILGESSASDKELAEATSEAGMVFYPQVYKFSDGAASREILVPLIRELKETCAGYGHINVVADIDGKIRHQPLLIEFKDTYVPLLGLLPALKILGIPQQEIKVGKNYVQLGRQVNPVRELHCSNGVKIPVDEQGLNLINYTAKWGKSFKHYSYLDVLRSYVQIKNNQEPILDLSLLKDKICFVGLTAAGTHDLKPVPLETNYPMVGVLAQTLNSVLQNKFLQRLSRLPNLFLQILLGCAVLVILKKYPPLKSLFLYIGLVAIWTAGVVLAFIFLGVWIDLFYPVLAVSLLYLGGLLCYYLQEIKSRLLINKELSLACDIQRSFLPANPPASKNLDLGVKLVTARQVGGDLYDFIRQDGKIGIFLGDVSGKGMPAALFMVMVLAGIRFLREFAVFPEKLLEKLNTYLLRQSQSGLFVTAVYLVYDEESSTVEFSNGGHLLPILLKKGEREFKELKCEYGSAVGVLEQAVFSSGKIDLKPGDIILIYTDGVIEARNRKAEEFGISRLKNALEECRDLAGQNIADTIYNRINKFSRGAGIFDDVTLIVLKIP